jgi:hypothetical protein
MRQESVENQAERIIAGELQRLGWSEAELGRRHKSDLAKLELAGRLRCETTLTMNWISARLHLGRWKKDAKRVSVSV